MIKVPSKRASYFYAFVVSAFLLLSSIYLQMSAGLQPCPLCVLQRIAFILIAVLFLFGAVAKLRKIGNSVTAILASLSALLGIFLSGRQVWLQHTPNHADGTCAASLEYMLQVLPFDQVLKNIFQGSVECTQVGWRFLALSLAEWSLICFVIFMIFSIWQLRRKK